MKRGVLFCVVLLLGIRPVAGQAQDATVHDLSEGVSRPVAIKSFDPQCICVAAMKANLEGLIRIEATVQPDGTVGDVKLVKSVDSKYGLNEAAVAAARQWVFKPGTKDGKAVAVRVFIEFAFAYHLKPPKSKSK
jgi:TonB family protein